MREKHFDFEEEFHAKEHKEFRKKRKILEKTDRSKFKKTDQDQLKKQSLKTSDELQEAIRGRVLAINPEGIFVDVQGNLYKCSLKGTLKKEHSKLKNLIAVGDFVKISPMKEKEGTIVQIEERKSILSRANHLTRTKQQLIAVNIDQVIITSSVILPQLKPHLIDRYIIAAKKGNMNPVIVINKMDLFEVLPKGIDSETVQKEKEILKQLVNTYEHLQIPIILTSTETKLGITALKQAMRGKSSVFSGQSGTGKSSLINEVTGARLRIGTMVEKTKKGSHTTTSAELLPIEGGGFCIDTPGIRSFGIWDLDSEEIRNYFPEIVQFAVHCRFPDCKHLKEPDCAVKKAVESHQISHLRFDSYCALMASLMEEESAW